MPRKIAAGYTHSIRFIGSSRGNIAVPITLPSTGTIHAVVRMNRLYDHNSFWDSSGHNNQWECWQYQSKVISARTGDSGLFVGSGVVENAKRFTAITLTWATGKNAKLYVDGKLRPTQSMTNTASSGDTFYWGSGNALNTASEMNFVEGKIFSQELTAGEVNNLVNTANNPYAPLVWHRADSSQGATVTDLSGNGYSGTLTNGTYETDTPTKLRTTASNRLAIQDVKSSLSFNGTSSYMTSPVVPDVTGFSFGFWAKVNKAATNDRIVDYSAAGPTGGFNVVITAIGTINFTLFDGAVSTAAVPSLITLRRNEWVHITGTYVPNNANLYINSVLQAVDGLCNMSAPAATTLTIGKRASSAANYFGGNIANFVFQNTTTPWTQAQITALYQSGTIPQGATAIYKLNEGAGYTAYDTSGNGNNGTITNANWSSDVPSKKRKTINDNLVYNGDFEYAPPFTAATNTQYREIDGTAGGRALASGMIFGWSLSSVTGGGSAMYDNGAMKVSTTATGSSAYVRIAGNAYFRQNLIKCLPNTSYTASVRIKTNYVSGDATTGARLEIKGLSSTYSDSATYTVNNYIKTTTDWTEYTITFTTGSSIIYLDPMLTVNGTGGAGTLQMSAWFDDIVLKPTTTTTRTAV